MLLKSAQVCLTLCLHKWASIAVGAANKKLYNPKYPNRHLHWLLNHRKVLIWKQQQQTFVVHGVSGHPAYTNHPPQVRIILAWTRLCGYQKIKDFTLILIKLIYLKVKNSSKKAGLGIRSFTHRSFAHSLILLKSNELLWAIRSDRSRQMSNCERIAQVAQDKWATVSESLRSLMTNEWPWVIHSGRS